MSVLSDMQKVIDKIIDHIDKTLTKGSVTNTQVASVLHFLNETQKKLWDKIKKVSDSALSKKEPDTAEEPITFAKGLTTLNAIIQELAEAKNLSVSEVAEIAKLVISGELKSKDYSDNEGFKIFRGENGWNIEIDNIIARKTFKTLEIVVQRVIHQGGQIIQSPAGGELVKFYSESPFVWAFYVNTSDDFFNGDLILCQTFIGNKVKRYWRMVDGYNSRKKIIFIRKDDCEAGSAPCEVGDIVVVFGNKSNLSRQNARIISVIGENSPYTADYKGINNYSLRGKLINQIGNLTGIEDPAFGGPLQGVGTYTNNLYAKGIFRFSSGERVEDYINTKTNQAKEQAVTLANNAVNGAKEELNNTLDSRLGGKEFRKTIDATALDENRFYPVMIWLNGQKRSKITVYRPLGSQYNRNNSTVPPSYSSHQQGFYTKLVWEVTGSGWGAAQESRDIISYEKNFLKENQWAIGDLGQIVQLSSEIVFVRGGSKYEFKVVGYAQGGWVSQFFPEGTEPIELYPHGFTYELNIKNNIAYGQTEQDRRSYYGGINFHVRESVTEPSTHLDSAKREIEQRYVTKSVHSADIEATNNNISQKVNRTDFDQHSSILAQHSSQVSDLADKLLLTVSKTEFDSLGNRVSTAESRIEETANSINLKITEKNAEQEERIKASFGISDNGLSLLGKKIDISGLTVFSGQNQKIESYKTESNELFRSVLSLYERGKTIDEIRAAMGNKTLINGGYIDTSLINVASLVASKAFIDSLRTKEFTAERVTITGASKVGAFDLINNSLYSDKPYAHFMVESDRKMAKMSLANAEPALHGRHVAGVGVYGETSHVWTNSDKRSDRVAYKGRGGVAFETSRHDYWRMPGVLWCGRINGSGQIEAQWGDGLTSVSVARIDVGVFRVTFSYSDAPQFYVPIVIPHTSAHWGGVQIDNYKSNNFTYRTVDIGIGRFNMSVFIAVMGVPRREIY